MSCVFLRRGTARVQTQQIWGGFPPRPLSRSLSPRVGGRGGGGTPKPEHLLRHTVQCLSALWGCSVALSQYWSTRDTGCVRACVVCGGVCLVSCVFLRRGIARVQSPQCRKRTLTTGLSPLELPTQQSHIGTWCHWHLCSSRLLGQSADASHISFCEWLRVRPRSILRNELDDSGHRGSSVGSQGRVLSSENQVSTVRRALQLKQHPPPLKDALGGLVVQVRVERLTFRELQSSALGHSLRTCVLKE